MQAPKFCLGPKQRQKNEVVTSCAKMGIMSVAIVVLGPKQRQKNEVVTSCAKMGIMSVAMAVLLVISVKNVTM
jgi:hypothetical protein